MILPACHCFALAAAALSLTNRSLLLNLRPASTSPSLQVIPLMKARAQGLSVQWCVWVNAHQKNLLLAELRVSLSA